MAAIEDTESEKSRKKSKKKKLIRKCFQHVRMCSFKKNANSIDGFVMWVSSNGERPNKSCRVETHIQRFVVDRSTKTQYPHWHFFLAVFSCGRQNTNYSFDLIDFWFMFHFNSLRMEFIQRRTRAHCDEREICSARALTALFWSNNNNRRRRQNNRNDPYTDAGSAINVQSQRPNMCFKGFSLLWSTCFWSWLKDSVASRSSSSPLKQLKVNK